MPRHPRCPIPSPHSYRTRNQVAAERAGGLARSGAKPVRTRQCDSGRGRKGRAAGATTSEGSGKSGSASTGRCNRHLGPRIGIGASGTPGQCGGRGRCAFLGGKVWKAGSLDGFSANATDNGRGAPDRFRACRLSGHALRRRRLRVHSSQEAAPVSQAASPGAVSRGRGPRAGCCRATRQTRYLLEMASRDHLGQFAGAGRTDRETD